jgi:hypothetical protein
MVSKSNKTKVIAATITFGVFMTEAILHYNMGLKAGNENQDVKFKFPPTKDFLKLAAIVGVFSVANGFLIGHATKFIKNGVNGITGK